MSLIRNRKNIISNEQIEDSVKSIGDGNSDESDSSPLIYNDLIQKINFIRGECLGVALLHQDILENLRAIGFTKILLDIRNKNKNAIKDLYDDLSTKRDLTETFNESVLKQIEEIKNID